MGTAYFSIQLHNVTMSDRGSRALMRRAISNTREASARSPSLTRCSMMGPVVGTSKRCGAGGAGTGACGGDDGGAPGFGSGLCSATIALTRECGTFLPTLACSTTSLTAVSGVDGAASRASELMESPNCNFGCNLPAAMAAWMDMYLSAVVWLHPNSSRNHGSHFPCGHFSRASVRCFPISKTAFLAVVRIASALSARN